jgi:hypothetical protein
MHWRVTETRRLLALLLSCRGVQFENANLCTDECIKRARESVYFAARGLTKIQEAHCRRSTNAAYQQLLEEVVQESNASEALGNSAEQADSQSDATATRAPPATSRGSRSSFTEQPQPAGYSLTIEYVFKVYGPYAQPAPSPFFQQLWATQAQSTYAVGRSTIATVITQRAQGVGSSLNPALHSSLRNDAPALVSTRPETAQALEQIRQEARLQNLILARREQRMELESALIVASTMPGIPLADLQGYRDRLLDFCRTPAVLPFLSADSSQPPAEPAATTATDVSEQQRNVRPRRTASPPRVIAPATSLQAQLQQLAESFEIVECGGDGACTFKVLRVIEWSLGDNRRALHNALEHDDHTHTRNRVVNWMEGHGDTNIFSIGGGFQTVTEARVFDQPGMDMDQYFSWMRDVTTSGGDIEIAAFAAMYVTPRPQA